MPQERSSEFFSVAIRHVSSIMPTTRSSWRSLTLRGFSLPVCAESKQPWLRGSTEYPRSRMRLVRRRALSGPRKEAAMSSGRLCARCGGRLPAFLLLCVLRGFDLRYFLQPQCPGGLLAQHEFLHLAAGRQGIGLHKLEVARNLLVTDLPFAEVP